MTQKEFDTIIARHKHWKAKDCNGWEQMRADLSRANLRLVDLRHADLSGVDLSGANLSGADLSGADLSGADLRHADLSGADLSGADLRHADLSGADLRHADLSEADLSGAALTGANLSGANLSGADLSEADLTEADLTEANLASADIYTAIFDKNEECRKGIVLKKAIKGYKKTAEGVVITAEIPAGAVVYSINGKKCRTNMATITDMAGHKVLHSRYNFNFTYHAGKKILISDFDTRYNVECGEGFHFFRTRKEAEAY